MGGRSRGAWRSPPSPEGNSSRSRKANLPDTKKRKGERNSALSTGDGAMLLLSMYRMRSGGS